MPREMTPTEDVKPAGETSGAQVGRAGGRAAAPLGQRGGGEEHLKQPLTQLLAAVSSAACRGSSEL